MQNETVRRPTPTKDGTWHIRDGSAMWEGEDEAGLAPERELPRDRPGAAFAHARCRARRGRPRLDSCGCHRNRRPSGRPKVSEGATFVRYPSNQAGSSASLESDAQNRPSHHWLRSKSERTRSPQTVKALDRAARRVGVRRSEFVRRVLVEAVSTTGAK